MSAHSYSRRHLLGQALLGSLAGLVCESSEAMAAKLNSNDPQAFALGYVENAGKVDVKRFPGYKAGQTCANCMLIRLQYGFYRPCSVFPKNVVNANGWCSAWVPKTHG